MSKPKLMAALKRLDEAVMWLRESSEPGEKPDFFPSYSEAREETLKALLEVTTQPALPPEYCLPFTNAVNECIALYDKRQVETGTPALFSVQNLIWKTRDLFRNSGQSSRQKHVS